MTTIQDIAGLSINATRSLLWQYNEAASLESLITSKQSWYDENWQGFWDDWYTDVFDIQTANAFGLTVWSIILNFPLNISNDMGNDVGWGFGANNFNFSNGNFAVVDANAIVLSLEEARLVLWLRAYNITSNGVIPNINAFLNFLFTETLAVGSVFARDDYGMEMTYIFDYTPTSSVKFVFANLDILPRPAAVSLDIIYP